MKIPMGLILVPALVFSLIVFSPVGDWLRLHIGRIGTILVGATAAGGALMAGEWLADRFAGSLFGAWAKPTIARRRHIFGSASEPTKKEAQLDAMTDERLLAFIKRHPSDALAQEVLCDRLKAAGDHAAYARECEKLLTLRSELSIEEKTRLYHSLADIYMDRLNQPDRARAALEAIPREFPLSHQATLARQRIIWIDDRVREAAEHPE
jgi:hypothetical protein